MRLKRLKNIYVGVILLMTVIITAGCQKSSDSSEESAKAVLNQFLRGTVQNANDENGRLFSETIWGAYDR